MNVPVVFVLVGKDRVVVFWSIGLDELATIFKAIIQVHRFCFRVRWIEADDALIVLAGPAIGVLTPTLTKHLPIRFDLFPIIGTHGITEPFQPVLGPLLEGVTCFVGFLLAVLEVPQPTS